MLAQVSLFNPDFLASLLAEFRRSMRGLLVDLCDELADRYRTQADALRLPLGYFRLVGESMALGEYSTWKVAGWIEELNDLVYFMDLQAQLRRERDRDGFAQALFAECEEKFYENSYLDDLFPMGVPQAGGLSRRLQALCMRLGRHVTQEALFLAPGLPCAWLASAGRRRWAVPADLGPNFERAERPGTLSVGLDGASLVAPGAVRRVLVGRDWHAAVLVRPGAMSLQVGAEETPFLTCSGSAVKWRWPMERPCIVRPGRADGSGRLTLGPTLDYGAGRVPRRVVTSPPHLAERLRDALAVIEAAWPASAHLLASLTSRVIPLRARGVVSFSYRHRPGLSFINMFDRDRLDLIDDLVHENSHHHLNLLLRKFPMRRRDRHQEIFYSPWRRSLRPLHGILHATFTFTMGARLFERLSSWGARGEQSRPLTERELLRARFRCLEEVESVRYSLRDLTYAAEHLGWLRLPGVSLVRALDRENRLVRRAIEPYRAAVLRSRFGPVLRRHRQELDEARQRYGPDRRRGLSDV